MSNEAALDDLRATLTEGGQLSDEQVRNLMLKTDLLSLGMLAEDVRRSRHGETTTFVRVAEVPVKGAVSTELRGQAMELRIIGVPDSPEVMVSAVRLAAEAGIPVTGYAVHDLLEMSNGDMALFRHLLDELLEVGLAAISELVVDRTPEPESVVSTVVDAGLAISRVTIHEASGDKRIGFVKAVAGWTLPDRGVWAFAPLPRADVVSEPEAPSPTGYDDVRQVALARLLVDNIGSIQVDWALHGPKLAQVALTFGADDIDAVPAVDAVDLGPRRTSLEEVRQNIRAASFVPVERNGCFESVM